MPSITPPHEPAEHWNAVKKIVASASGSPGTKYKFRSEYRRDASLFLAMLDDFVTSRKIVETGIFADVEGEFFLSSELTPGHVLWAALQVPDGHVLVQTLELEHLYSGDREYDRNLHDDSELEPGEKIRTQMRRGLESYVDSLTFFTQDAKDLASSI